MEKYMLPLFLFIIVIVLGIGGTNLYNKRGTEGHDFQPMEDIPRTFFARKMDEFYNNFLMMNFLGKINFLSKVF